MDNLEIIRKKCIEANPTDDRWNVLLADEEKVRLADVLLAVKIHSKKDYLIDVSGHFCETISLNGLEVRSIENVFWNFRKDSLEDQSEVTKNFLAGLLK